MKKNSDTTTRIVLLLFVFLLASGRLSSQISVRSVDSVAKFQAIPNDLAFQMLGLPGNNIQQPGTVSYFLASIQPAVNLRGELSPGLAVSVAPYQMLMGNKLQLHDYVNDGWTRLLANTQISIGSAPSKNADTSQDWGIGVRFVILNSGDGRLDPEYINSLVQSAKEVFDATPMPPVGGKVSREFVEINNAAFSIAAKIKSKIAATKDLSSLQQELKPFLDSLKTMANQLKEMNVDGRRFDEEASSLSGFVSKYSNPQNLIEFQKLFDARSAISSIKKNGDSPGWNTTTLDLDVGTVYRATRGNVRQSQFSKLQIWLNGGVGLGSSQLLGQVGYSSQYGFAGQPDSSYLITAVMYRYGNEDIRFGIGGNGIGFDAASINLAMEIRVTSKAWIVASFNRDVAKGAAPTWSPAITVKTSGGFLGL